MHLFGRFQCNQKFSLEKRTMAANAVIGEGYNSNTPTFKTCLGIFFTIICAWELLFYIATKIAISPLFTLD